MDALRNAPDRIAEYYTWITAHDSSIPEPEGPFQIEVVESFHSFPCLEDPEYLVNAFFEDDRRPLTVWDVDLALRLFEWTRKDLLSILNSVSSEQLYAPLDDETRGSVIGIVEHIAAAEDWYLDQFDLGLKSTELPEDVINRLYTVRTNTRSQLVKLIGIDTITENCGERWSPRKVVRRALWHERDHTQHITKRLSALPGKKER
jgi:hypothetical protein